MNKRHSINFEQLAQQLRHFFFARENLKFLAIIIILFIGASFLVNATANDDLQEDTIRDFGRETEDLAEEFDDMVSDVESEAEDWVEDRPDLSEDDGALQTYLASVLDDDLGDFANRVTLVRADNTAIEAISEDISAVEVAPDMEMVLTVRDTGDESWWLDSASNLNFALPFEWTANSGETTTSVLVVNISHETIRNVLLGGTAKEDLYAETESGYALLITPETDIIAQYGAASAESHEVTQLLDRLEGADPNDDDVYTLDSHVFISEESLIATRELDLEGWHIVGSIPTAEIPTVSFGESTADMFEYSEVGSLFSEYVEEGVDYLNTELSWFFRSLRTPIETVITAIEDRLLAMPWQIVILGVLIIAWLVSGRGTAYIATISMFAIGLIGLWDRTMTTMAMLLTSMAFCVVIGIPLGILSARSERANGIVRSVLDAMQTIHPFVYLVPIVVLFGIGKVPGTIATIIFALPPMVRLTNLGIRQVPEDVVEAARSFGSSDWQLLRDVQLPLALPSIMAGVNQTLMLSLSMVVIVALIAGGGLGEEIYRAIGRADTGRAVVAGTAVLLLAVAVDRISQGQAVKPAEEE